MKIKILMMLLFPLSVFAEYILYRLDQAHPGRMLPIAYDTLSADEQESLQALYYSVITYYQWPTILSKFTFLELKEKNAYLKALDQPNGLLSFMHQMALARSRGIFGVAYIPTTIFEMVAILVSLQIVTPQNISELYQRASQQALFGVKQEEAVLSQRQICAIGDYIISSGVIGATEDVLFKFVEQLGLQLALQPNVNESIEYPSNALVHNQLRHYPWYDAAWLPIMKNYIKQEIEAQRNNCFTLVRGTNGFNVTLGKVIDYELGKEHGFSYGYSLFAGSFFERYYSTQNDTIKGARVIDYIYQSSIGYVLLLPIKDALIGNLKDLFWLPPVSILKSLFLKGELFHPRLRFVTHLGGEKGLVALIDVKTDKRLLALRKAEISDILSQAKLIKYTNPVTQSSKILHEDLLLQQYELEHAEMQQRISLDHQSQISFYDSVVVPWVMSGQSLAGLSLDSLSIFKDELLNSLTDAQLRSLTSDMLVHLKIAHPDNKRLQMFR